MSSVNDKKAAFSSLSTINLQIRPSKLSLNLTTNIQINTVFTFFLHDKLNSNPHIHHLFLLILFNPLHQSVGPIQLQAYGVKAGLC